MNTDWHKTIDYINKYPVFTLYELYRYIDVKTDDELKIKQYISLLYRIGIISFYYNRTYQTICTLPSDITINEIKELLKCKLKGKLKKRYIKIKFLNRKN